MVKWRENNINKLSYQANAMHLANAALMLVHRLRGWPNIKSALFLRVGMYQVGRS